MPEERGTYVRSKNVQRACAKRAMAGQTGK